MYVLRSVCRCGLHSQDLIKQLTMGKPFWTTNMYSASSIQGVYVQVRNLGTKDEVDENVKKFRSGNYETIPDPQRLQHFKKSQENIPTTSKDETPPIGANALPHPIWSEEEVHKVEVTHKPPEGKVDKDDAKMLDVILAIRADEAHHRVVNHTLASLKEDDYNPYKPGE